jgi:hypothetical protein
LAAKLRNRVQQKEGVLRNIREAQGSGPESPCKIRYAFLGLFLLLNFGILDKISVIISLSDFLNGIAFTF